MQITEPVTMLTDYALGAADLLFTAAILSRINPRNKVTGLLLALGFLTGAISGFAGGAFHGFSLQFEAAGLRRLWNTVVLSVGATGAFFGSAVHTANVQRQHGKWIVAAVVLTLAGLGVQMTGFRAHQHFNHNDIFHVIQILAMYVFFIGARGLQDRAYSPK